MQAELAAVREAADRDPAGRKQARDILWPWKMDWSYGPVRSPELGRLPEDEQAAWQAFWQEVNEVFARTRP
jgi:hypothetical protein